MAESNGTECMIFWYLRNPLPYEKKVRYFRWRRKGIYYKQQRDGLDDGHIPTPQTMAAICSYFTFSNEIVENIFFDMWFSTE